MCEGESRGIEPLCPGGRPAWKVSEYGELGAENRHTSENGGMLRHRPADDVHPRMLKGESELKRV